MIAFISDIHSNTEALEACLREIESLGERDPGVVEMRELIEERDLRPRSVHIP